MQPPEGEVHEQTHILTTGHTTEKTVNTDVDMNSVIEAVNAVGDRNTDIKESNDNSNDPGIGTINSNSDKEIIDEVFGPWMLAKWPIRRRDSGNKMIVNHQGDQMLIYRNERNGSRFQSLPNQEEEVELDPVEGAGAQGGNRPGADERGSGAVASSTGATASGAKGVAVAAGSGASGAVGMRDLQRFGGAGADAGGASAGVLGSGAGAGGSSAGLPMR
ncbi:hypothetical protein RIF29_20856 [Crotalaria pallida]|uniref:Uncharacterized protein n=1 Tax=Crotalaria pallida TaxID=3830 RepID=A0AAN9F268_CROPI